MLTPKQESTDSLKTTSNDYLRLKTNQILYELGFLNRKFDREKDLDRRWRVNINEAELIIRTALMDEQKEYIKQRMEVLCRAVLYHQKKYHEEDAPEISDEVYDSLIKELRKLEAEYPELKLPDSPSDRIGGEPK